MGILDFFFARKEPAATAGIAKERLQIVLAHERAGRDAPEFLPAMQRELLAVVRKYVTVKEDEIRVNIAKQASASVLEINIEFDASKALAKPVIAAGAMPARVNAVRPAQGKSAGKRR
jgi:cell division topological specificity factor